MTLHENRHIDFFLKLLYLALILAASYVFFKYFFGWVTPLIIAYLMSALIIKPVNALSRIKWMPRKLAAGLCTLIFVTLIGFAAYFIISRVVYEGVQLFNSLPDLLASLPEKTAKAQGFFDSLLKRLPAQLSDAPLFQLESWLASLKFPQVEVSKVFSSLTWAASSLPTALLTIIFVFMATFFLTSDRASINQFVARQISPKTLAVFHRIREFLYSSVFKWLKAQCILISITFCELAVGFAILRQPYVLALALLIAMIDALPILGVGTVLIPWAIISLLSGEFTKAAGLCIIYAVVLAVRNMIEPRIVGAQIGLNPFITLLCMYFGFRMAGFLGMFMLLVAALILMKLHEWDYIHIWKA